MECIYLAETIGLMSAQTFKGVKMFDAINKESLDKFVDIFYNKARNDRDIGPVFNAQITSEEEWEKHKAVVSSFWLYHFTGIHSEDAPPKHKGGMMGAHQDMPPFPREHFGIWMRLFEEALNEVYDERCKNELLDKAKGMSVRMQEVLYEGKEWPPKK